ncbi:MAG: polyketide antibiotic transporter [Microbacterium sp.]|uniref:ABC transporter permease n=1 Tax=Microbacterium sp. TaxID=51671 RepID=UPI001AD0D79D|nr:polyketide antibiotic transporter [Microbacterium sp.]MBN9176607.1 polyketide antibiotic transporter [Microbacterium sp.]
MSTLLPLLRQRLRRDAVQLILWIGGTAALAVSGFAGVVTSYGDAEQRTALLATVMANPVILLFRGLPSGAGESQMVVFLLLPWLLLLAALMSSFLAVRHTRGDEEDGRLELLSATPAGRWMPLVATLVHGIVANIALGALVGAAFLANGAAVTGSVLVGVSCTLVGVVFLGVGLVAAQLMPTSRGANALAVWVLVGTFVLAGIGNTLGTPSDDLTRMYSSWVTWLSPFGWAENVRAFDADAAGPVGLLGIASALFIAAAAALQSRRDIGGAFVAERTGRARARADFGSNLALITRQSTASIVGWVVGGLLTGVLATSLGAVANQIGGQNPSVAEVLDKLAGGGGDLERGIVVVFFLMLGILAACAGVQTIALARREETRGTAEIVLATPISRVRWLADYLIVAMVAAALTLVAGTAGAVFGALTTDDTGTLVRDAAIAAAGQLPAAWVFVGLTALIFVLAPRLTIAGGWVLVMVAAMIGLFGPLFGMAESATKVSPFAAAPSPTTDGIDAGGLWWIVIAVVALTAASVAAMRRRELAPAG